MCFSKHEKEHVTHSVGRLVYGNLMIETALGPRAALLSPELGLPRASTVGLLGARLASEGAALAPERVELRYLRPAEAEERRMLDTPGRTS